ncbi:MAG: aminotransferase class I/II-fold pyridoxal phosphate-dependent enzyme [Lachnospiraceae bacterium]|nr:aminotransferase class I/II-fold pyridoxal phosphate-dependent enzyme [Lachnospiraceae bacterium]
MLSFMNDYSEGAHPQVIRALARLSEEQNAGYGTDRHAQRAADLIRTSAHIPRAQVAYTFGGTQANALVIAAALRPFEAVIAADSGHINVHETGAIEATGHTVLTWPHEGGKLTAEGIEEILWSHSSEHMVSPRMVYLSDTTEWGTVYTKAELAAISEVCRKNRLVLYLDGARLAAALTSSANDMTLADIASMTDAFTVGGTKNGALCGEAIVLCTPELFPDFRFMQKRAGALPAKGFAVAAQFEALLEGDLYFRLGEHANRMAGQLAAVLENAGVTFYQPPVSNQLFPIFPGVLADLLVREVEMELMMPVRGGSVCRLVTSWATKEEQIEAFENVLWNLTRDKGIGE